jgi:hypothetical protein
MNPVAAMVTAAVTAATGVTMAIMAIVATANITMIGGVEHRRLASHAELSTRVSPDELRYAASAGDTGGDRSI